MLKAKGKKKSLVGWVYGDEDYQFSNIDAYGYLPALNLVVLKRKSDLGKFEGKKVRITIEEL